MVGLRFGGTEKAMANANLTAQQILDRGAERVTAELQGQPVVQAALEDTIGNVYLGMGMIEKAEALLQDAFELRQKHLPRQHLEMASSLHSMGMLRFSQLRFPESESNLEESLAIRRKLLGNDHALVAASITSVATILSLLRPGEDLARDVRQAESLWRESLAWHLKHFGDAHIRTALAKFGLGGTLLIEIENGDTMASRILRRAGHKPASGSDSGVIE